MKYAEDLPYWKTGQSSDRALTEAKNAIINAGGVITGEGYGTMNGEGAFFLQFQMDGDTFRFVEPVMESRNGNDRSAKIQAAASLKHAIKARVNEAVRHGARRAFLGSLVLSDGRVVDELSNEALGKLGMMLAPGLPSGVIEGEYE